MTFEEKFPSLKDKIEELNLFGSAEGSKRKFVILELIEENCLDKQRVREVIQALRDLSEGWISGGCDAEYCMECFDDKVKELGL